MKSKKPNKKLSFSKTTIVSLGNKEQRAVKGGYYYTEMWGDCYTWHPVCFTKPVYKCLPFTSPEICA